MTGTRSQSPKTCQHPTPGEIRRRFDPEASREAVVRLALTQMTGAPAGRRPTPRCFHRPRGLKVGSRLARLCACARARPACSPPRTATAEPDEEGEPVHVDRCPVETSVPTRRRPCGCASAAGRSSRSTSTRSSGRSAAAASGWRTSTRCGSPPRRSAAFTTGRRRASSISSPSRPPPASSSMSRSTPSWRRGSWRPTSTRRCAARRSTPSRSRWRRRGGWAW